jgi:hypothetical protein
MGHESVFGLRVASFDKTPPFARHGKRENHATSAK